MTRSAPLALVGLALVAGAGCVLPRRAVVTGRPLPTAAATELGASRANKAELFATFGAPNAIVGPGEEAAVDAATVVSAPEEQNVAGARRWAYAAGGTFPIQGDAVLELFADRVALDRDHRVYYYFANRQSGLVGGAYLVLVIPVFATYGSSVDELYVLVNERTGRVDGAVFRPAP